MFKRIALYAAETAVTVGACLVVNHYVSLGFDKVREYLDKR
jgi:hypothetical protein